MHGGCLRSGVKQREQEYPGHTGRALEQLVQCGIGWSVSNVVKECGSGITNQHPKVRALLADPKISQTVVEHQGRASRFGVTYMQTLLDRALRELVVVNTAATAEDDVMGDFLAIIPSFCARLYGRRRTKHTTEQVLAALEQKGS